jgi:hypothetical protein
LFVGAVGRHDPRIDSVIYSAAILQGFPRARQPSANSAI